MEPFTLVIFGITSNLAQKYLMQALYDMEEKGILPNVSIIGNARRKLTDEEFSNYIEDSLKKESRHHKHEIKLEALKKLISRMSYVDGYLDQPSFYPRLKILLDDLIKKKKAPKNLIFYLATYPDLYHHIFENLQKVGLNKENGRFVRLLIEKPIGNDFESAKNLNHLLSNFFSEKQIYRLDHYLGKETLQNILTFRFGNGIFEPLINKDYIDHIQITASEDFGIGSRGGYYDSVGALKDVGQNHNLQMLAFATMDAPAKFSNEAVTKERIKIFRSLSPHPNKIVFGQYDGYTKEDGVAPDSSTDTFYALKTEINNGRFKGVPIYVRAGKMLKQTVTEISIVFKNPENRLFKKIALGEEPNVLIYRIQPNEGIVLKILVKKPGSKIDLEPAYMQYCYPQGPGFHLLPDPYERLLSDAIRGDQTFFSDAEEVEAQWKFIDPLARMRVNPVIYKGGTWGPKEADKLLQDDGREWLEPSMQFCNF